jgi:hypothetical protein
MATHEAHREQYEAEKIVNLELPAIYQREPVAMEPAASTHENDEWFEKI